MCYNEYTGGVNINSGCIKTTLGKRISLKMVHSGYNLHKVLRHTQQYCLELHAYVVKCKNTYGMIVYMQGCTSSLVASHLKTKKNLFPGPGPSPVKPESLGINPSVSMFCKAP